MRRVFANLPLKVVSVALSSVLWYVIAGEKTSEMGLSVPLELRNFPADLELTGEAKDRIEVRLRASPGIIQRIAPGAVSASIDLSGMRAGEHIVHLTEADIRMPFGVRVVKIHPSVLTLNLEPTARRTGPQSRIALVESVYTEGVAIDKVEATLTREVNVGLPDPLLRLEGSPRVRVTTTVREMHETRLLQDLAVEPRGGAASLRPATVAVLLAGPASALRGLRKEDVRAHVDLAAATGGDAPVAATVAPGHPGVTVQKIEPERVSVHSGTQQRKR